MHKYIYRKSIFILWVILEVIFAIVSVVMTIKKGAYTPHGFLINKAFLDTLVQYDFYLTLQKISFAFLLFFGAGLVFYGIGVRKVKRNTFFKKIDRGLLIGVIFLPLAGTAAFCLPEAITIPDRLNHPANVQIEQVTSTYTTHSKSGTHYFIRFTSGSDNQVSQSEYYNAYEGKLYYLVYQGKALIETFPADRYIMRN